MKFFTNQSIWKKIVMTLLIVLLFNVVVMKPVHADSDSDVLEGGGKLLKPIFSLLVTVGDGIINVLHSSIMGVDESLILVDNESTFWSFLKAAFAVFVTVGAIIGAIVLSGGVAAFFAILAVTSIASSVFLGSNFIVKLQDETSYAIMSQIDENALPAKLYFPLYSYSPEEIFKGKILLFNVDFFREPITIKDATKQDEDGNRILTYHYYEDEEGEELDTDGDNNKDTKGFITSKQDSAEFLQKTISSWYNAIRNICLVLMLSILVYIGIRMLLSSVASDKAKYLTMLKDWFTGLCLLFLMHYIMAFSVTIVNKITNTVGTSIDNGKYAVWIPHTNLIEDDLEDLGMEETLRLDPNDAKQGYVWPSNLMGYLRLKSQMNSQGWQYIGEAIMFLTLTILTLTFTFTYLKRLLYMAFLTIIAPMVALTYCIDKLNDGQAQGFNKWLKEYIFNLLIQPMHLLLYYILITSSFEMMGKNVIYSIVAIGFMIPAEKLLRSLFGFEKAQTASGTGTATAMMASTALNSLLHKGPRGKDDGKNGGSKGSDSDSGQVPMPRESNPIDAFLNNNDESNLSESQSRNLAEEQQQPEYNNNLPSGTEDNASGDDTTQRGIQQAGDGSLALGADGIEPNDSGNYGTPRGLEQARDGDFALGTGGEDDEKYQGLRDAWNDAGEYLNPSSNRRSENLQFLSNPINGNLQSIPERPPKKRKIKRAIGRRAHALRMVGRTAKRQALQNMKKLPGKGIRMAGRGMAGVAVGALAAGAGVAIGAATGDIGNVAKMGTGAAASGFAIGSGSVKNTHVKQEYKDAYNDAKNGSEYEEEAMQDYIKNYKKDIDNRTYFENELGIKEARKMYKSGEIDKYLENGITDKKEMKAMHKLQEEGVVRNIDEAIAVSQLGDMMGGSPYKMNEKNRKDWSDRISNMAEKAGVKKEDKEQFAADRFNQIEKLFDFKK